jgi:hypothetical protein
VKSKLTIVVAVAALAATATSFAAGGLYHRGQVTAANTLPDSTILNSVRALGFVPTTRALRRGPYYVLHAYNPRGVEVRIVADAELGDIVSVEPLLTPHFDGGARVIHVPRPGDRSGRAMPEDDRAAVSGDDDDEDNAPPPRRAIRPSTQRDDASRARAEKPLGPPRNVLSAPPPSAETLTPVYPTPKFNPKFDPKNEPAEKFAPPDGRS